MGHPDRWWYQGDLAKHLGLSPSSLQRELTQLTRAGILRQRPGGNRVYFQADPDCPFLPELQGLLTKTADLVDVLRDSLAPLEERIDCAFVHGSIARAEELATSDVDLIVVGDVGLADLVPAFRSSEPRQTPELPDLYALTGHVTIALRGCLCDTCPAWQEAARLRQILRSPAKAVSRQ